MAVPTLSSIAPSAGPASGGDLVRLAGTGFAERVEVRFDGGPPQVLQTWAVAGVSLLDVRTPRHQPAVVDVSLQNLDADGAPVPGEAAVIEGGYTFRRAQLVAESDLTRLVRALRRQLKHQVLANTGISVSVDFVEVDPDAEELLVIPLTKADLPSLTMAGPRVSQNRALSTNVLREEAVVGESGAEIVRRRSPLTVDLEFQLTVASQRTTELLNLMTAVAAFFNDNPWIELPRDGAAPDGYAVRFELELRGDLRARLDVSRKSDVRVFTAGFAVVGFDIAAGLPFDRGKAVDETVIATQAIPGGGEA